MKKSIIFAAAALSMLYACDTEQKWKVTGTITDAPSAAMIVEASDNGRWYTLDTVRTTDKGEFSYSHSPAGYPDIYRLTLDGHSIYFPVDSVETVTITSSASAFDRDYTLSGTPEANRLMDVEKIVRSGQPLDSIKRNLAGMVIANPSDIVAYYIISRQLNGAPIFNPADKFDNRLIGAVANAYDTSRPADPRTGYLRRLYLSNRQTVAPTDTIAATETGYFELDFTDNTGKSIRLSDIVADHKVVLLDFTAYTVDGSPAYNALLAETYTQFKDRGFDIYQVAFDPDEFQWKQSAKNLPWATVYCPTTQAARVMNTYNITTLPTAYIIYNGELVKRVTDLSKLRSDISYYL